MVTLSPPVFCSSGIPSPFFSKNKIDVDWAWDTKTQEWKKLPAGYVWMGCIDGVIYIYADHKWQRLENINNKKK